MCEQGKVRLPGAKFALLNCEGQSIACGETNCSGEIIFDCLPFGKYFIKEIEAPCGYEQTNECVEIVIGCQKQHRCVEFVNIKQSGSIKVVKFGKNC